MKEWRVTPRPLPSPQKMPIPRKGALQIHSCINNSAYRQNMLADNCFVSQATHELYDVALMHALPLTMSL